MTEAQLMTELAESCRRLARYQRNPNILDMLHDLEEDFIQEAGKRETETSGRKSEYGKGGIGYRGSATSQFNGNE